MSILSSTLGTFVYTKGEIRKCELLQQTISKMPSDSSLYELDNNSPLNVNEHPEILRFTFRQFRVLLSHLSEYPALEREERGEFLQKRFEEVWLLENPNWDWDSAQPNKKVNSKYHWVKQVRCT